MARYRALVLLASAVLSVSASPARSFDSFIPTKTQSVLPRDGALSSPEPTPFCTPYQDPDNGIKGYCQCSDGNKYSFANSSDICPYTSPGPAALSVHSASSSTSAQSPDPRCTNPAAPDEACFNSLDLPDYIIHWWNDNQNDCGETDGFADCWYSKKTKYAPSKCDQLNTDPACEQPEWSDFQSESQNAVQDFYVTWVIWNTQGFFLDLYNAIGGADQTVQDGLSSIVTLLDPPQETGAPKPLEYVLDALTFGLSLYSEGSVLTKALLRSAPQTSSLIGKLFPSGTVDGEFSDWSQVSGDVGKVTDAWKNSVASGLPELQNNITAFIAFNQQSGLSGIRPSLDGLENSMSQALNTYAISDIINTQGLVASRAVNTDVHALQTNGTKLEWDTGCGSGYTEWGVCDTFFWDGTDTYGLTDPEYMTKNYNNELNAFFNGSNPLTTGKLLFTGGLQCAQSSGQNGGAGPTINSQDPTQYNCMSTLRICTWTYSTYGPFQDCPNLPDKNAVLPFMGVSGCIGSTDDTSSIDVPHAYLGGGILVDAPGDWASFSVCDNIDY
ncbi:hypothetical protein EV356DRAFT_565497 [Viridothelium virens]|uniref:Uncharacterized protein n=1 Tax=Viridothelium virens TaxID=1048519 RepID=A0A6A6HGU6_VIRVR|nr:hypothetical protein EV356DRAFT_565497 [Viridothelium virens]